LQRKGECPNCKTNQVRALNEQDRDGIAIQNIFNHNNAINEEDDDEDNNEEERIINQNHQLNR